MIVIVSKIYKDNELLENPLVLNEKVSFVDDFHINVNGQIIEFDYLLCDDLNLLNSLDNTKMLIDDVPVTNFFGQTSLEHIYIGPLDDAIDHLVNGE